MAAANNTAAAAPVVPTAQAPVPSLDLGDLELPQASWDEPAVTPQATTEPDVQSAPLPLNLDDDLSLMDSGVAPLTSRDAKAATSESLEFDLGDLSLDLDTPTAAAPVAPSVAAKERPPLPTRCRTTLWPPSSHWRKSSTPLATAKARGPWWKRSSPNRPVS